jgi:hypothetical protein
VSEQRDSEYADLRGEPLPDHLAAFWDRLDEPQRAIIRGQHWRLPNFNHPLAVSACVTLFLANNLTLDDALQFVRFDDGLGWFQPLHGELLRQEWQRRLDEEAKQRVAADNAGKKAAEYLVVTDEPWEPATLPARPWLAMPYLMRSELTLPHGPGGGGKSQLAIAWSVALALGKPFGRLWPKQRARVVLTNFEDSADEQKRRITAALEFFGVGPAQLKGWLYRVCVGPNGDATMFEIDERGAVVTTPCFDALVSACETIQPDCVFLDPLVAINAVPEADNQLMRRMMVILRARLAHQFNAAVVPLHHDNKSGDDNEGSDQTNVRGGGDIVNGVRFELAVKKMTVLQAEQMQIDPARRGYYFRLGSPASKLNYSAPEESEWFERLTAIINEEEVVRCIPWEPPSGKLDQAQISRLIEAIEKGTKVGPYSPQLGNTDRSLGPVLVEVGVVAASAQRWALRTLYQSGRVVKAKWKLPGRGSDERSGLRTDAGLPYNWEWSDRDDEP